MANTHNNLNYNVPLNDHESNIMRFDVTEFRQFDRSVKRRSVKDFFRLKKLIEKPSAIFM